MTFIHGPSGRALVVSIDAFTGRLAHMSVEPRICAEGTSVVSG